SVSGTTITSRGETYTNNWFRAMGEGGIYFQKYGGGWYMTDTNTITAYAGKNIQTAAGVYGGYVHSTGNIDAVGQVYGAGGVVSGGRTTVGEYLQLNGVAYAGNGCSPNGLQGRAVDGSILSCTNGVWKEGGGSVNRMFIVVEGKCYVPNKDTGGCSCPNDPNRLKQIEVSRYRGNECNNGGSNCREPDRRLYTCN
ncbi:TPA: shufflon system plasmid conjugative transfer pilus tip adhesin PilV, partial [Salmonella enterica subsp. enterica serovar Napoli]|nr:shufflon system plasmid conjugative transfer pilus tip adhesin PilV [Salmonella enterica subsp. enterica serovar Napoli]EBX4300342.1 hypothetical protein [Salmonella enterica subsp. enterica serovar Napoli]EIF5759294.1 shufflon system plasmid conjugative transfer pilus tip adhesin PilV [Salmonella enterica subsp. enterica serovar Napoli]HBB7069516.1 shufflon system plasmid conjugative transfer pilus tip adhesin PilV [Salmonella enterica subsp. enterica serovar Napoli]HBC0193543.1 shufflon sy